jgi:hypothetical protein
MRGFTNKRLAKEKFIADIFERFGKTNLTVSYFCEKEGIPVSVFYYWKARLHQEGLKGLVVPTAGQAL